MAVFLSKTHSNNIPANVRYPKQDEQNQEVHSLEHSQRIEYQKVEHGKGNGDIHQGQEEEGRETE